MHRRPKRGEIWYHNPSYTLPGNLYNKDRPVVIVSDNALNNTSDAILAVPCTKQVKKNMESHAEFVTNNKVNTAMAEQTRPILLDDLVNCKRKLTEEEMLSVDFALINALGLQKYIKEEYSYALNKRKTYSASKLYQSNRC
jgi:mRNA-degrading endonuclease toxin of MazEF toxin-antitoxin module